MDITVTLSAMEAMQIQAGLGDRIARLASVDTTPGTLETSVIDDGLTYSGSALHKIVEQLYPDDLAVEAGWDQAKAALDQLQEIDSRELSRGDHFRYPTPAIQVYEGMD